MIALLGSQGMLGSMIKRVIPEAVTFDRPDFDALDTPPSFEEFDLVINAIGKIKPYCSDVEGAIRVNALFPHQLPTNTIQIATDCVYSGLRGSYVETDPHDALDVYGKTKSLGEAPHIKNLRCSIIGPEVKTHSSLMDWFLAQKEANGFTNHMWNGVTTYHFAKVLRGIVDYGYDPGQLQHLVPGDVVSKYELLTLLAYYFDNSIKVTPVEADEAIDRTLKTNNPKVNKELWKLAGYDEPPSIDQMIWELSKCEF